MHEMLLSNLANLDNLIKFNSVDYDVLFTETFLQKTIKPCKSSSYMTIIEIFKVMRPLTSISSFVNIIK